VGGDNSHIERNGITIAAATVTLERGMGSGFLSERGRDWVAVIGLTIGIIQLVVACVGWLASIRLSALERERPRVSEAAARLRRGVFANIRLPRFSRFERLPKALLVAAAAFAVCLVGVALRDIPFVGEVMLFIDMLATLVQWGALMELVLEFIPERWDGSVARLTGILFALVMFGSGSTIAAWTLQRTQMCADSDWICALASLEAGGCIAVSTVLGLSYVVVNGFDWFVEWRRATRKG
jgi:hypothetical protein